MSLTRRLWEQFGKLGAGGYSKRKWQPSDTGGEFRYYGRNLPASGRYSGTPGSKRDIYDMFPKYVSDADVKDYTTEQKMLDRGMRRFMIARGQPGMGPRDPKTGKATPGAIYQYSRPYSPFRGFRGKYSAWR